MTKKEKIEHLIEEVAIREYVIRCLLSIPILPEKDEERVIKAAIAISYGAPEKFSEECKSALLETVEMARDSNKKYPWILENIRNRIK